MIRLIASCILAAAPFAVAAEPLYPNSIVSNDLDFISAADPGACWSMTVRGTGRTEMYDPRRNTLFVQGAMHFDVTFPDKRLRINVHPDVGDHEQRAMEVAAAVARLPVQMRQSLLHINILDGDGGAWSEDAGRFFTLYDTLITRRLAESDLNETVFHEAAHVALDQLVSDDRDWQTNRIADGGFLTRYAAEFPDREDIAESALFAWTITHRPDRLPADVIASVRKQIPNRLQYLGNMLKSYLPPSC